MTASELITHLRSRKAVINVKGDKLKISVPESVMTPKMLADLKKHKSEIIEYLQAANDGTPRSYAYHFEFDNNAGAGTWRTELPPEEAKKEFTSRFSHYTLTIFTLIN